jgi:hypothetical protein
MKVAIEDFAEIIDDCASILKKHGHTITSDGLRLIAGHIIDDLRADSELDNCKKAWALVSTERDQCAQYLKSCQQQLLDERLEFKALSDERDTAKELWSYYQDLVKGAGFEGITDLLVECNALAKRLELIDAQEPWGYVAGSSFVKERPSYQTSADWSPVYEQKPAVHVWPNVPYGALVEHNQKLMRELEELRKQDADTEVQHPALHIDDNGAVAYSVSYDGPLNGEFYAIPQSKEFMEACAQICDQEAEEWDSDNVVTEKNYAAACATRIRALLSGSPTPDQCPSHESGQDEIEGY